MQRTLILACWPVTDPLLAGLDGDPALLEIAGKSTLQRSLEQAVALGARQVDVVLGEDARPIENCLGDGERWGCEITYHYSRAGGRPLETVARRIAREQEYLVLQADRNLPPGHEPRSGRLGCWYDGGELRWCGWGRLSGGLLADALERSDSRAALEKALLCDPRIWCEATEPPSRADSAAGLVESARRLLADPEPPVGIARTPSAPGLWIGNGCRIHASARIVAPVFLGEHVFVGPGAVVGPYAVVGDRSVVDREATVVESVAAAGSYLGAGVELHRSLLVGRHLVNVPLNVRIEIPDRQLAGTLLPPAHALAPGPVERLVAACAWVALLPLHALAAGAAGEGLPREAIRQAVPGAWLRHFRECFHPGLARVIAGRLRLVGLEPRTPQELARLPEAWRRLHREAGMGLLNEALLLGAEGADPALAYAGDALATNKLQFRHLVGSVRRYAAAVVADWKSRRATGRAPAGASLAARGEGA